MGLIKKPGIGGWVVTILIALLASALIYAIALHFEWLSPLNTKIYDLATEYRLGDSVAEQIVVIAIDRNSLDRVFPQPGLPLSRHLDVHANAVLKLDSAGVRLIVFDVLFDRLTGIADSSIDRFASVIAHTDKVILASSIERQSERDSEGHITISEETMCLPMEPILRSCKGVALIDMPADADGTIRRCYYGKEFQGDLYPSIERLVYSFSDSTGMDSLPTSGSFHIDYSYGFTGIPTVSYEKLLTGDNWQHLVRGRVALIGLTNNGKIDRFRTPISHMSNLANAKMSGVEIHAHAAETLLEGAQIMAMSYANSFLISTLLLGFSVVTIFRIRIIAGAALALGILVTFVLLSVFLIAEYSLIFPIGEFIASLMILVTGTYALNLGFLRTSSDSMGRQLAGIRRDLDTAGLIQRNLQPAEFPENERLEISAAQESYSEVGGDYYDVVELDDGCTGILIADVSGKGVSGSLIMSNLQGRFRQIASDSTNPGEVLSNLNVLVNEAAGSETMFATLFYGIVDTERMLLKYANAGHCTPILCSKAGETGLIDDGGTMIGPFPDMQWDDYELGLSDGDLFCLYSDGISETWDKQKKNMFDDGRIEICVKESCRESTESILSNILKSCRQFAAGGGFDDDWTLLLFRIHE